MAEHPRFAELLTEGLSSVARRKKRSIEMVMEEIAHNLGYSSYHVVAYWRRGNLPPLTSHSEYIAAYCIEHGRVNEAWANEFLAQAGSNVRADQLHRDIHDIPNNLPAPDHASFIGRKAEMTRLLELLSRQRGTNLISVDGIGGVGKTTLVLEAALRCLRASTGEVPHPQVPTFDAIIFASAKQQYLKPAGIMHRRQAQRTLQSIFRTVAHTLKRPDITRGLPYDASEPNGEDTQLTRVLEALGRQRTLLIVDNLETMEEKEAIFDFLFDLPPTVKAVITTRERATFSPIRLDELPLKEGLDLIAREAKDKAVELADEVAQALYARTGGVPAAIVYAIGRMSMGSSPQAILEQLGQAGSDVARFCFAGSVAPLRGHAPHRLLMALAMFPKRPLHEAVVEVADLAGDPIAAEDGLRQLQQLSLITQRDGRYRMLPLTREYALAELAAYPDFDRDARERWVRWYITFAKKYGGEDWADWHTHYDHIEQEWENLLAVFDWCAAHECYAELCAFWQYPPEYEDHDSAGVVGGFSDIYGYWHDRLVWLDWIAQQAERRGDWRTAIGCMRAKGFTLTLMARRGQLDEANTLLMRAWDLREYISDIVQAHLAQNIGILRIRQEEYADAQRWLELSAKLLSKLQLSPPHQMRLWIPIPYYLGEACYRLKDYERARTYYQQVIEQAEAIGWQRAVIYAQNWLADIAIAQRAFAEAERLLKTGLAVAERNKDPRRTAFYKRSFAHLAWARGAKDAMRRWAAEARDGFDRLGMQPEMEEMYDLEHA